VWEDLGIPIESADLAANPPGPGSWAPTAELACRFINAPPSGASPKFECALPEGEVLKVKYGYENPEVRTEVAASRLLRALGFGADPVYVVRRVRCFGCPEDPYEMLSCIHHPSAEAREKCAPRYGELKSDGKLEVTLDYARYQDFEWISVERKPRGRRLGEGWSWDELGEVDARRGGSPRPHLDALRLAAALLDNWDNKASNQRLLCRGGLDPAQGCRDPFAYMQDVGGTFGRPKLDLTKWREAPIWKDDARACVPTVESPPLHGSTWQDVPIGEEGRRLLAERLARLTPAQMRTLFTAARFAEYPHEDPAGRDVAHWVTVFQEKVRQVAARGPCPAS
jgi:hypothetical protein